MKEWFSDNFFPYINDIEKGKQDNVVPTNYKAAPNVTSHKEKTKAKSPTGRKLKNEFISALITTYPIDGVDPVALTLNNTKLRKKKGKENNSAQSQSQVDIIATQAFAESAKSPAYFWTTFLGIPNRITRPNLSMSANKLTVARIIKNFFGWHDENSPLYQKILNYTLVKPLLIFLLNLISILPKTIWNIAKLATQFIPSLLENLTLFAAEKLKVRIWDKTEAYSIGLRYLAALGIGLLLTLHCIFKVWRLVGRTFTDPLSSVKAAIKMGEDLGGVPGKIVSGVATTLSILMTVTLYTLALPVLFHLAVANSFAVALQVPTYISKLAAFIAPVLQTPFEISVACSAIATVMLTAVKQMVRRAQNGWYNQVKATTTPEKQPLLQENQHEKAQVKIDLSAQPDPMERAKIAIEKTTKSQTMLKTAASNFVSFIQNIGTEKETFQPKLQEGSKSFRYREEDERPPEISPPVK